MKIVLALLTSLLLLACSSKPANEPTPLYPLASPLLLSKQWSADVGIGDDDLSLFFSLSSTQTGDLVSIDQAGRLSVVDARSGDVNEEIDLGEAVIGGLGEDDKHLYYTTLNGDLVALDRQTYEERWRSFMSAEVSASPVSNSEVVIVHTSGESLRAHSAADGKLLWRYDSVAPILTIRGTPRPQFNDDNLITTFANGELIQFDWRSGEENWQYPLSRPKGRTELERLVDPDGGAFLDGRTVYAVGFQGNIVSLDAKTGGEYWKRSASSFRGLAVLPDVVVASLEDGVVTAYRKRNSMVRWSTDALKHRRLGSPIMWGERILVPDFEGYIHVLEGASGELIGRIRPDDATPLEILLADDQTIYIYLRNGDVVSYSTE